MSTTAITETTQTNVLRLRADDAPPRVIDNWWRGDKEGKIQPDTLGYPSFYGKKDEASLLEARGWVKEHMTLCFRMWGDLGYSQGVAGHITVRDPLLPDHYWINPLGVHFSLMTTSHLVLVGPNGYVSPIGAQLPINQAGYSIHSAIHRARPEVSAAAHCHTQYGRAWSVFGKPVDVNNQDACYFYNNQAIQKDGARVAFGTDEGRLIAETLGPTAQCGILQNHGLITVGNTVDEVIFLFNTLEKQCQIQLLVEAAQTGGLKKTVVNDEDAEFTSREMIDQEGMYSEFQPEIELYKRRHPDALA